MKLTLTRDYFDRIYSVTDNPWELASSGYEAAKAKATIDILGGRPFDSALEIGCAIGIQTLMFARICRRLLAIDTSARAVAITRSRTEQLPHVTVEQRSVPAEYPDGMFDLTSLSEVGYYFAAEQLQLLSNEITAHTSPGGYLLLVHWLLYAEHHPMSGDQVHELFLAQPRWHLVNSQRAPEYRIDLLALHEGA